MSKHKIRHYIRKERRKGVQEEDILDAAIEAGYDEEAVLEEMRTSQRIITAEHILAIVGIVLSLIAVFAVNTVEIQLQEEVLEEQEQHMELVQETIQAQENETIQQAILTGNPQNCAQLSGEAAVICTQEATRNSQSFNGSDEEQIFEQAVLTGDTQLCNQLSQQIQESCKEAAR